VTKDCTLDFAVETCQAYNKWLPNTGASFLAHKFQLVAGNLALDFANTLDYRFDSKRRVELLPDYASLLEFVQQCGVITQRQAKLLLSKTSSVEGRLTLRRAVVLREAIDSLCRSVLAAKPPRRSCLRSLNRFLESGQCSQCVLWQKPEYIRIYSNLTKKGDAPLGPIVGAAANLLTSPVLCSIRECADPSCRWLFLDQSKNHSRRWCDMKVCGNRSKVRRFRARR
jgi:predicted RNA-binding Zn ribbon-like protein